MIDHAANPVRFEGVVRSEAELRAVAGPPQQRALDKVTDSLDALARRFIEHSPFLLIASRGMDGRLDISPRGDPEGFIGILDERTIAIPDRPGNGRLDTFTNVLSDPNVSLLFLVPGVTYTLRVRGRGTIVRDMDLRQSLACQGKVPAHVLVVDIDQVFSHCPKCMVRSKLWQPEHWSLADEVPPFAEMLKAHAGLAEPQSAIAEMVEASCRDRLY